MNCYIPLVSIAITCYNQGHFIIDAFDSVLIQKYTNWELIVVNDCSSDNSLSIINKYVEKHNIHNKIKIITHEINMGYGYSLGEAIRESKGELVVIMDSDDALSEDYSIDVSVKTHLEHPDVAMTYSNYWDCDANLNRLKVFKTSQVDVYLGKGAEVKVRVSHLKTLKKMFYVMTDGINPKLKQTVDKDLILKMEEVGKLLHIDQALYDYRLHSNNISTHLGGKSKEHRQFIRKTRLQIFDDARKRRGIENV